MAKRKIVKKRVPKVRKEEHWLTPFMKLREELCPYVGSPLYHGVILTTTEDAKEVSRIVDDFKVVFPCRFKEQIAAVHFRSGIWAYHYFFFDVRNLPDDFKMMLVDFDGWLEHLPEAIFPRLRGDLAKHHITNNLLRWLSLLYYLGWKYKEDYVQPMLKSSSLATDLDFENWGLASVSTFYTPRPYVTLTEQDDPNRKIWKPGAAQKGRECPELVEAWFSHDVFDVSAKAIVMLKYYGAEPVYPQVEHSTKDQEEPELNDMASSADYVDLRDASHCMRILKILVDHHRGTGGIGNYKPLTQQQIVSRISAEGVKTSQSTVSRCMSFIIYKKWNIKGAMDEYVRLCKDEVINESLLSIKEKHGREWYSGQDSDSQGTDNQQGNVSILDTGKPLSGQVPKSPDELAMENESAELFQNVIHGIIGYIDDRCDKEGIKFPAARQNLAEKIAARELHLWIDSKLKEKSIKRGSGSEDEAEAIDKILVSLLKNCPSELGDRVFKLLPDGKSRP